VAQPNSRRFEEIWRQFSALAMTHDALAHERRRPGRWRSRPFISFVVSVDDLAVQAKLVEWQHALRAALPYRPQPADRLHITLHEVSGPPRGARHAASPAWRRGALARLAASVRAPLEAIPRFTIYVGPLNAFDGGPFAEVQDPQRCLRLLRTTLRGALPMCARPVPPWQFLPHITLGHWGAQPIAPLVRALEPFRKVEPVPLRVTRVLFTAYARSTPPLGADLLEAAHVEVLAEFHLKD